MMNAQLSFSPALEPNRSVFRAEPEAGFGALDAINPPPVEAVVTKSKRGRKKRPPVVLSPEEELLLKTARKETEKLRRAAMTVGFDGLKALLPRDWLNNKVPNQTQLLELVLQYIKGLEQDERDKMEVVRRMECEVREFQRRGKHSSTICYS
ncbi:hypothetical protein HDU98_004240 [Podochytrium sp. JEL0797]|nr:hypothetical protein HDU98_004240 [Podochytrium sp. JEL0797]